MDIVERAKAITLSPAATWPVIEAEQHTPQSLYIPYLVILAAIPAVAMFIGMSIVGMGAFGFSMRLPITMGLAMMVTNYVLTLVMTFAMGWVVSALAPTFGGQSSIIQGLKLVVFGSTPMLLAGILNILPALGMITLLVAFYALYVMYIGMPVLMKNPKEKTIPYMLVVAICGIVAGVVLGTVTSAFRPAHPGFKMGGAGGMGGGGEISINTPAGKATINTSPATSGVATGTDTASMTIKTPDGEVKIDVKQMEAFAKQMQDMAAQMEKSKK
jgi:Yip1 domain